MPQGGPSWGLPQWMGETQFGQRDFGGREGPPSALPAPALQCAPPARASASCECGEGVEGTAWAHRRPHAEATWPCGQRRLSL